MGQLLAQFNPEADFSFSGYVEVYPEARVGQYKGLTVTATRVDVKPEQIDQLIDRWRDQRATLLPVEDRPAQLGDVVVIDFEARDAEGNSLDEMATQDFQLELKEDNFIPGFVAGIVGMQLDETKEIAATFPDDYFREEVAGKTVTFIVSLKEIKAKELPELDDAFVQEISSFQTVAELREHLQKRLEQDALRQSEENLETALLNAILETTEVDLPETLIEQETTQLLAQSLQALRQEGIKPGELRKFLSELPPETLNQLKERHRPEAIDRLRRTLALSAIVRQEQIAVGSTELDVEVEEVMAAYAQQGQKLDRERVRQAVYEGLLTNKVMAWLKSQTTVNWVDSEGNPTQAPTSLAGSEEKVAVPEAEFEADGPEAEVSGIPEAIESSSETATGAETDGEAAAAEAEPATEKAVEASPAETVSASAAEATLPVEEKAAETATEIPAAEKPKPSKKDKKGK